MSSSRPAALGPRRLGLVPGLALCVLAVAGAPARAQQTIPGAGQKPGNELCLKLGEETPELYGPTDIGAATGNQRLSVAVNPQGTLSVFRWPSPSFYDQVKYATVDRDLPRLGLSPNEGVFSGLALHLAGGKTETVWLRDLEPFQRYASEDSDTVATRYRSAKYGLSFEIDDVVPQGADVLLRRHVLRLRRGSPVQSAELIAFANFNPTASKRALLPTEDWCEEEGATDQARYDQASDAIVYEISETDQSLGSTRTAAIAFGASAPSTGHQVGADRYTGNPSAQGGPPSAYDDAADDGRLSGSNSFGPAEVDSALSLPIAGGRRAKPVTVLFAAGPAPSVAIATLAAYRGRDPVAEATAKRRSYLRWLRRAPLPKRAPAAVRRLAKRALISLRQATDEHAGRDGNEVAIVASIATQSPYGEDWIRDGAFFNETLDEIGQRDLVERHNAFYAEVQRKVETGAPPGTPLSVCGQPTPDGNWVMNNYADGPDGGPFTWEIDEAAYGLWTLWRHYDRDNRNAPLLRPYLERVYPSIRRTAEFLVVFRDPVTGLTPGGACEDDNPPKPGQPTMHASGPVLLAMRSAADAATVLGKTDDAKRYRARAKELAEAIDSHYNVAGGAWSDDYGIGGWALWPVQVRDFGNSRMRAQAEAVWKSVEPSFEAPKGPRKRGQYEGKALLGLARYYRAVDRPKLERVKRGLRWIAEVQAAWQPTGILGETWYVRGGRVISVVSQPHVWEQTLFYLAAVEAYGRARYRPGRADRLAK